MDYPDITAYLESLGAPKREIESCPQKGSALKALAAKYGGDLTNKEAVKAAGDAKKNAAKANKTASRQKKMRPISDAAKARYRRAFDHYDEDDSGELDMDEFRKAMIDSGMMPLAFEVKELFMEADTDNSGTVDFDEYCQFVALYKAKQGCCEMMVEKIMDMLSPQPAYMLAPAKEPAPGPSGQQETKMDDGKAPPMV